MTREIDIAIPALIVAAGRPSRVGINRLLTDWRGRPLIRAVAEAAVASRAGTVLVVAGHEQEAIAAALDGLAVRQLACPEQDEGLAAALRCGVTALPAESAGVLVAHGDMPLVRAEHYDAVLAAFASRPQATAVRPTFQGRRGHPALLSRRLFPRLATLAGEQAVRRLFGDGVLEVAVGDPGILRDADLPALAGFRP